MGQLPGHGGAVGAEVLRQGGAAHGDGEGPAAGGLRLAGQIGEEFLPNGGAGGDLQLFHQGHVLLRDEFHHVLDHPVVEPAHQLAGVEDPPIVQQQHPAGGAGLVGDGAVLGLDAGVTLPKNAAHRQDGQEGLFAEGVLADHLHLALQDHPHEGMLPGAAHDEAPPAGRHLPGAETAQHGLQILGGDVAEQGAALQFFQIDCGGPPVTGWMFDSSVNYFLL